MSFINSSKANKLMKAGPAVKKSNLQMKIDVVSIPQGASISTSLEKREQQMQAINQIKTLGRDLFEPNSAVLNQNGSKRLYQTADLYSETLSLEKLIPMLTASGLTLKLNAQRHGTFASNTCMELKTGQLADLVESSEVDDRNEKTCSVAIESNSSLGAMYVGVKVKGGKHFIQKLDYEVEDKIDDKMHA